MWREMGALGGVLGVWRGWWCVSWAWLSGLVTWLGGRGGGGALDGGEWGGGWVEGGGGEGI